VTKPGPAERCAFFWHTVLSRRRAGIGTRGPLREHKPFLSSPQVCAVWLYRKPPESDARSRGAAGAAREEHAMLKNLSRNVSPCRACVVECSVTS
jgi:hypothetical protein